MPARNEHTGDLLQTKSPSKEYLDNYSKLFGNNKPIRGRFKQCRETGKMIPIQEWNAKYGGEPANKGPMVFCNHFEPFESPVTGRVISSKRAHEYDLQSTGSRVYEGRDQETKEAQKWQQEQDSKLEARIEGTLNQTMHEIEHGYRRSK